ncbi:MAG: SUMF1/EgtB/PvdO family nonheme iron enzyme [Myxococcota bacterium]
MNIPPGATDLSEVNGGVNGSGLVRVNGFDIPAGEIAEVRVRARTHCGALKRPTIFSAQVRSEQGDNFTISTTTLTPRGPGVGLCDGIDPDGPFADADVLSFRRLRGGGGCSAAATSWPIGLIMLFVFGLVRRARSTPRKKTLISLGLVLTLLACGTRHKDEPDAPSVPRNITDLDGLPGSPCGSNVMVWVTDLSGGRFCIDRFEAATDGAALGNVSQASDETISTTDGSTSARALVELAASPAREISWYQAKSACMNAGKRLCTVDEWEIACRGPDQRIYPYADTLDESACNGFFNFAAQNPLQSGSLSTCGSAFGVYDMSGNLEEWVETATPRTAGQTELEDRFVRGGSFKSNSNALACFGMEFHAPPSSTDIDRGFRCCADGPVP